ncbi:MAG: RNA 3'-terminal phosphate cyclase [Nanoarchaeota archaeon]|nr:RNA 3'-terminal phosphate cyclase [Nanoarchaeota archaeon]MBU1854632.1 RNA 3'-terminal phosphate cyclase [Nanoarchaeota archaeon]
MIKLDGSHGEGGGAILRQALALSTLTGKSFEINNIRKGRPQPGLKAQHLHSIIALEKISGCSVTNCEVGSEALTFIPGEIKNKTIDIDVGTAGSITLLMQSLIMPIVFSGKKVTLNITGGTDVKWSQPIDYFTNVVVPRLKDYADIEVKTMLRGYYPKGGGKVIVKINSKAIGAELKPLELTDQGELLQIRGVSHASSELENARVADRQASTAEILLSDLKVPINISRQYANSLSIGSGITLWAMFIKKYVNISVPIVLGADSLGDKGKKAEEVGREAALNLKKEISSKAVIDQYLTDQLIPMLGIVRGAVKTSKVTNHTKSNIYVTEQFLDVKFKIEGNIISV